MNVTKSTIIILSIIGIISISISILGCAHIRPSFNQYDAPVPKTNQIQKQL